MSTKHIPIREIAEKLAAHIFELPGPNGLGRAVRMQYRYRRTAFTEAEGGGICEGSMADQMETWLEKYFREHLHLLEPTANRTASTLPPRKLGSVIALDLRFGMKQGQEGRHPGMWRNVRAGTIHRKPEQYPLWIPKPKETR